MNPTFQYVILAALGYILGCSNMAFYLAKLNHVDIRKGGSGNLGASNALITLGKGAGAMTLVHDFIKAVIPILIARMLFPETGIYGEVLTGTACVLGHMYPFWLGFKGGKGFASYLGCIATLDWRFFLILVVAVILITVLSDYIVFATTTTVVLSPIYLAIHTHILAALIIGTASLCILWKHRINFVRIYKKEEIGLRHALSGKGKMGS